MTWRAPTLALTLAFLLAALTATATGAAATAPSPSSMAAVGDSMTQAASTGGSLGADAPQNSWATGWSSSVHSHAERLGLTGAAYNLSVSGAKAANLNAQMLDVAALTPDPGYLTVLIGGNDLCTDTLESMTSETAFESAFHQAMTTIKNQSPGTYVYVVSIPDVYQLWSLFKNNFWARFVWSSASICQSLLANPTSTKPIDANRRLAVQARNIAYNAIMARICDSSEFSARCRHDGGVVFRTALQASDVSGDYFHPSASGQNRLAEESWNVGYSFGSVPAPDPEPEPEPDLNVAPSAAFSFDCTHLSCGFTDASSDIDGTIASWSWSFGDGASSTDEDPSHAYATAGSYTATLTVTDDDGAQGSASQSFTVSAPSVTLTLGVSAYKVKGVKTADLTWSGATTSSVVVYRDGVAIVTTANDGAHTDSIGGRGGGTHTYKVCETGSGPCSNEASASY